MKRDGHCAMVCQRDDGVVMIASCDGSSSGTVMLWSIVGWLVKRGGGIVETESCDGLSRAMTMLWRQCHDRWFAKRDGSIMEMVLCNGSSREMVTLWKVLCDGSLKSWR